MSNKSWDFKCSIWNSNSAGDVLRVCCRPTCKLHSWFCEAREYRNGSCSDCCLYGCGHVRVRHHHLVPLINKPSCVASSAVTMAWPTSNVNPKFPDWRHREFQTIWHCTIKPCYDSTARASQPKIVNNDNHTSCHKCRSKWTHPNIWSFATTVFCLHKWLSLNLCMFTNCFFSFCQNQIQKLKICGCGNII